MASNKPTDLKLSTSTIDELSKNGHISIYTYALFTGHLRRLLYKTCSLSKRQDNTIREEEAQFWQKILSEILENQYQTLESVANQTATGTEFIQAILDKTTQYIMPLSIGSKLLNLHAEVRSDLLR